MSTTPQPKVNVAHVKDDAIDLVQLVSQLCAARRLIIKITTISACIGIVVALFTPNTYLATTIFVPNSAKPSASASNLKGLAALAGVNIGNTNTGMELSPMLYSKIIESAPFKKALLNQPVPYLQDSIPFKNYLMQQPTGFGNTLYKYTLGLPSTISGALATKKPTPINSTNLEILTDSDFELFKQLETIISIQVNDKDGYIQLNTQLNNPLVAAQITKKAELLLQQTIIALKTKQSQENYTYIQAQYQEKKQLLENAQNQLARFKDRNLGINSFQFSNQQTRLETNLQIATSVFQTVTSQLEEVKLQLVKDTPIFSVLQPVVVPNQKSAPKRGLIVFVWVFLGAILACFMVFTKQPWRNFIKAINNHKKNIN